MKDKKDEFNLKEKFLFKSIRSNQTDFWRSFCYGITQDNETPKELARSPLRISVPIKERYGLRIDGVYKVGTDHLFKPLEKKEFSKHQSCSVASPEDGFYPPVVRVIVNNDKSSQGLVGVRFATSDALIQRIFGYDADTVISRYRTYKHKKDAEIKFQNDLEKNLIFKSLEDLIKVKPKNTHEIMARLKWTTNQSSQICIFEDNLQSRLLAVIRALDLYNRLKEQEIYTKKLPKGYKIPISFYLPDEKEVKIYSESDYQKDMTFSPSNKREQALKTCCLLLDQNFLNIDEKVIIDTKENIDDILNIAKNLTYSTSHKFFEFILKIFDIKYFDIKNSIFWEKFFSLHHYKESCQNYLEYFKEKFPEAENFIKSGYISAMVDRNYLDKELIKKLISKDMEGAKINDFDNKFIFAAKFGRKNAITVLAHYAGSKIDFRDGNGQTALIHSSKNGHFDCVKELLYKGANKNILDNWGNTAIYYAIKSEYKNCEEELKKDFSTIKSEISEQIEIKQKTKIPEKQEPKLEYTSELIKQEEVKKINPSKNVNNIIYLYEYFSIGLLRISISLKEFNKYFKFIDMLDKQDFKNLSNYCTPEFSDKEFIENFEKIDGTDETDELDEIKRGKDLYSKRIHNSDFIKPIKIYLENFNQNKKITFFKTGKSNEKLNKAYLLYSFCLEKYIGKHRDKDNKNLKIMSDMVNNLKKDIEIYNSRFKKLLDELSNHIEEIRSDSRYSKPYMP